MTDSRPPEGVLDTDPGDEAEFAPPSSAWLDQTLKGLVLCLTLLLLVLGAARLGARTDAGRTFLQGLIEGVPLGPVGRLHVEGLAGDVFTDFQLRRLAIVDSKGAWIEAANLDVKWSWAELAARRLHIRSLSASRIVILRQPVLAPQKGPQTAPGKPPVTVVLDSVRARIETRPDFSVRPGLWDLDGQVVYRRNGSAKGLVRAASRLHAGDGVAARFRIGEQNRVELKAEAVEAAGGALAGALGMAADKSFSIRADADGVMEAAKLRLVTRSGDETPLTLDASWGKDGAALDAEAHLGASSRVSYFSDRIGPTAKLVLSSRRLDRSRFHVDVTGSGAFARLTAHGAVNMKTLRAEDMDLWASVDDLQKWWVPVPKIGGAEARGKLNGALGDFVYKAKVEAKDLDQNGYHVARLSGTGILTHARGEFRLGTEVQGQGGGGDGLLWMLFGPSPQVSFEGLRLPEGRYVFKRLKADGSHIHVDAEGGQALFGGFSFNGKAVIDGVGLGKRGSGTLTGGWTASIAKGADFWQLGAEAEGKQLVTGAAEFDRLVGASPRLTGRARWTEAGLEVEHATLAGAAIDADLHGLLDRSGGLKMNLDWAASGPFGIGPVEIAGAAHGKGDVTGEIGTPRADLTAELAEVNVGALKVRPAHLALTFLKTDQDVEGLVSVTGPSLYGDAQARSAFRFLTDGIELKDVNADAGGLKITGSVAFRSGTASSADLVVAASKGAFLTSGRVNGTLRINDAAADAQGLIDLTGQDVGLPGVTGSIRHLRLTGSGPLDKLPFDLKAEGATPFAWKIQGQGRYSSAGGGQIELSTGEGKIRKADFHLISPMVAKLGEADRGLSFRLALAGGEVDLDAAQKGDSLKVKGAVSNVTLQSLSDEYIGQISGSVDLNGRGPHLAGEIEAQLTGARSRDAPVGQVLDGHLKARLEDQLLTLDADAGNAVGLKSHLTAQLPAEASAYPFRIAIDRNKPLQGEFAASGEVRPLWDLLAGGDRSLSGDVAAHGALSGSINHIRATGEAKLAGGQLRDAASGLYLKDLAIASVFDEGAITVQSLSGSDGRQGSVTGEGVLSLASTGISTLKLDLKRFQLIDNEVGRAQASGQVTVTRDANGHAELSGALTVDRADIAANPPTPTGVAPLKVREIHIPVREGADAPQPRSSPLQVAFNVTIKAVRGVFVRGKGLDAELSLDSHVGGDSLKPELTGIARIVRGSYDFSGKRFDFNELGKVTLGSTPETIRLDLTAQREDPSLTAYITVSGTAAKPQIALTSSPVYPQDEVLSRVLFGVSASQLSPFQAAQLASALASMATGGGFDIIGGLRQFARLDRLSIGTDQSTVSLPGVKQNTTISGGKYLSDNVYIELTGGGRLGPTAQVEVRVQRHLSVISQVGTQGDASLSVSFRQNYK